MVVVDGRSGCGKTTCAAKLANLLDDAVVVHTDGIAWNLARFDWAEALAGGVMRPWRRSKAVSFRPPGWEAGDRPGTVQVPACRVLVVEGVGAARAELAPLADLVVWIQSDRDVARQRDLQRDFELAPAAQDAATSWNAWMTEEGPFLAAERPWRRASLVVNGTPPPGERSSTLLAEGPIS